MFVVLFEGLNGTGKSTYVKRLVDELGVPQYRPLKVSPDDHWWAGGPTDLFDTYRGAGVPVNTYVDDIYAADAITKLRTSVVLDRSMPSSFVYGGLAGEDLYKDKAKSKWIWDRWSSLLGSVPVLYVYLTASYQDTKSRCAGRWHPSKRTWTRMTKLYQNLNDALPFTFTQVYIHTSDVSVDDGTAMVIERCRALTKYVCGLPAASSPGCPTAV